jgi:hypothetical protein
MLKEHQYQDFSLLNALICKDLFLAHLAKGHVSFCHHLAFELILTYTIAAMDN